MARKPSWYGELFERHELETPFPEEGDFKQRRVLNKYKFCNCAQCRSPIAVCNSHPSTQPVWRHGGRPFCERCATVILLKLRGEFCGGRGTQWGLPLNKPPMT